MRTADTKVTKLVFKYLIFILKKIKVQIINEFHIDLMDIDLHQEESRMFPLPSALVEVLFPGGAGQATAES